MLSARVNNAALGLTGMLLYTQGNFFQVLEGAPVAIHGLMGVLEIDRRHAGIRVLCDTPVQARVFADWTMAQVVMTPSLTRALTTGAVQGFECETAMAFMRSAAAEMRASA